MLIERHHITKELPEATRLIDYLSGIFPQLPTHNRIKKAIKKGAIRLNGAVVEGSRWVKYGDIIELHDLEEKPPKIFPLKLEIVCEDDFLAVVWKPAGIVVSGNQYKTLTNALGYNLEPSSQRDALPWMLPVHRLDAPTSGLVLIAKTVQARIRLARLFEQHAIRKKYRAIVVGETKEKGIISTPIEGQNTLTEFIRLQVVPSIKNKALSLVELLPTTGRTHQLRIHLSGIGHPIVGDKRYSPPGKVLRQKGLFLSATGLSFEHPLLDKKISLERNMPYKFTTLMEREVKMWKRKNNSE